MKTTLSVLLVVLTTTGLLATGVISLDAIGDRETINPGFGEPASAQTADGGWVNRWTGGEYNSHFAIPGVIEFSAPPVPETPIGGPWAGAVMLFYLATLIAIRSAPPRPLQ